ncbi:class I SAM-dependent methyltransferase [Adlercreutzia sp. ZJ138]|uniref:class I SAM-dependent methyltransferase n=1 Tax=Adlercreutzia sp. ZJ138 TaxID=2709405 RepID=UPI0013EB002F|nr:class I SAM-dependent methyltransferase [Adlercreutzia sp. ZJ138]
MQNDVPLLIEADWINDWKHYQALRRRSDNAAFWDERSKTFTTKDAPSAYIEAFLRLADIQPGNTVFDMGCGNGALALPLARAGHAVIAADFSRGMLDILRATQATEHLDGITTVQMSWEDDWGLFGVGKKSADVCIASRSLAVADLRDALLRLTAVARKRVCITLATGASPRTDERVLRAIGLRAQAGRDYQYAFNILANEGIQPTVSYIDNTRTDTFDSFDAAYLTYKRMIADATAHTASDEQRERALPRLQKWLHDNLVSNEHAGEPDEKGRPQAALRLAIPRTVRWAFLSWEV